MGRFVSGFILGAFLATGGIAYAQVIATVDTNGVLKGYTVQKGGENICSDPVVWHHFRGQGHFIVCPD